MVLSVIQQLVVVFFFTFFARDDSLQFSDNGNQLLGEEPAIYMKRKAPLKWLVNPMDRDNIYIHLNTI